MADQPRNPMFRLAALLRLNGMPYALVNFGCLPALAVRVTKPRAAANDEKGLPPAA